MPIPAPTKRYLLETLEEERTRIALPADITQRVKARIEAAVEVAAGGAVDDDDLSRTAAATQIATGVAPVVDAALVGVPKVGDVLNERFLLKEKIGSGGMSVVFKAIDQQGHLSPEVAVKVLNVEFGSSHPEALNALRRETANAQKLAHQNIVHVRDFGMHGDTGYMWMEFLEGRTLAQRLNAKDFTGMPVAEAMCIIEGMADALAHAHRAGMVHADFKPGNVILTREPVTSKDQVKVIDFGISRAFKPPDEELADGDVTRFIGNMHALTPPYASPEMIDGEEPSPQDDIYALGCIAYQLFAGRHPFSRMPANEARERGLKPVKAKNLTRRQHKALCGALAFEREKRTPSVDAFCEALRNGGGERWPSAFLGLVTAAVLVGGFYLVMDDARLYYENLFKLEAGDTFVDSCGSACPKMLVIPAGTATQGSPAEEAGRFDSEGPLREVTIGAPFAIGRNEVTVEQFAEFVAATGHDPAGCWVYDIDEGSWVESAGAGWRSPGFEQRDDHPVTCVSWHDAVAYAAWLESATGESYRLPSSSEWEYVARAGSSGARWWGSQLDDGCNGGNIADRSAAEEYSDWSVAECDDGVVHTAPVGRFDANAFGAHDTLGNVFEWVADCWNPTYAGAPTDGSAWLEGECDKRVLRGGSWFSRAEFVRVAYRNRFVAEHRSSSIGFRVARDLSTEELKP